MAELPPDFQVPTPQPIGPSRPPAVRVAAWVLIVGGAITALGGGLLLVSASEPGSSLGAAFAAFGAAEVITGLRLLQMRPAFRSLGIALAAVGIVVDIAQLVAGSRWQILALLAHAFVVYVLWMNADAFHRAG